MKLKIAEREIIDPGFRRAYQPPEKPDAPPVVPVGSSRLARLKKGETVKPRWVSVRRQAVPTGMTEAALIGELQRRGIGRPSTYASAIATLIERGYATRDEQGRLSSTERGRAVCDFLTTRFGELFADEFTARMETRLDDLAAGRASYAAVLGEFWQLLSKLLGETFPPQKKPPSSSGQLPKRSPHK
jgi:DNA topoisomerase IA